LYVDDGEGRGGGEGIITATTTLLMGGGGTTLYYQNSGQRATIGVSYAVVVIGLVDLVEERRGDACGCGRTLQVL